MMRIKKNCGLKKCWGLKKNVRVFSMFHENKKFWTQFFSFNFKHQKTFPEWEMLGSIGSAVFMFIGYNQTRQAKCIYIDVLNYIDNNIMVKVYLC